MPRNFGQRAGEFHTRGATSDHHERQQPALLLAVLLDLGAFKGRQHARANLQGVFQRLEARRVWLPVVPPEIGVRRAGCHNQMVIRHLPWVGRKFNDAPCRVDATDVAQPHAHVGLSPQNPADRRGDITGRECRSRHLIQQRLKDVVVLPVEHDDLDIGTGQRLRGPQTAESPADDHDSRHIHRFMVHQCMVHRCRSGLPGAGFLVRGSRPPGTLSGTTAP